MQTKTKREHFIRLRAWRAQTMAAVYFHYSQFMTSNMLHDDEGGEGVWEGRMRWVVLWLPFLFPVFRFPFHIWRQASVYRTCEGTSASRGAILNSSSPFLLSQTRRMHKTLVGSLPRDWHEKALWNRQVWPRLDSSAFPCKLWWRYRCYSSATMCQ